MKKNRLYQCVLLLSLFTSIVHAQSSFSFDFNEYSGGYQQYNDAKLKGDFGSASLLSIVGMTRASVGNKQLRAKYPKNKILGSNTGFRFEKLLTSDNEAVLEYRVKFDDNFDWSKGGKLPGLAGSTSARGRGVYGCNDNRSQRKKGFSTRLMWRENGKLIFYPYAPLHPNYNGNNNSIPNDARKRGQGRCGGDIKITDLQKGRWYTIKQYIKLNTFKSNGSPNRNGIVKIWINGQLALNYNDFVLAGERNVKVNAIAFHTYRGGSTNQWASNRDGYAFFDDIKACTNCTDVSGSNDNKLKSTGTNRDGSRWRLIPILARRVSNDLTGLSLNTDESTSLNVYPNPAEGVFNVVRDSDAPAVVNVFSMTGMLIDTYQTQNTRLEISTSGYRSGLYLIEVDSEGTKQRVRLLVK